LFFGLVVIGVGAAAGADEAEIARVTADRARYGFDTDRATVVQLLETGGAPESDAYGFPMTRAEATDLYQRSGFVQRLSDDTLPYVERLDGYAGHWIDQRAGGQLVVMLTKPDADVKAEVRSRMPKVSRGVRFENAEHDMDELQRAFRDIETNWPRDGVDPVAFALDERNNRFTAKVPIAQLAKANANPTRIRGIDIKFESSAPIRDAVVWSECVGRWSCYAPLRLGARAFYSTVGASWRCGIGFNVKHSTNSDLSEAFLTAGHCGYNREGWWRHSQNYQDAYGAIGKKKASPYDAGDGRDLMIVKIADWTQNKSKNIYGEASGTMLAASKPSQGETLWMSLAQKSKRWTGTVDARSQKWKSTNNGEWMWGSGIDLDGSKAIIPGDSGSPIYRKDCDASPCQYTPVGIVNAGTETEQATYEHGVYFAKVWWAVNTKWPNMYVYKGPDGVGGPP
jgi:hypothetical protein